MSDSPWIRWYPGDYFAKTGRLTRSEHGAYCLLLFHYYCTGPLPNNDADLAALAKCSKREWAKVKPRIWCYFSELNGTLHNTRCDDEIEHRKRVITQKKEAGSIGGKSKHTLKHMIQHPPQHTPQHTGKQPEPEPNSKALDLPESGTEPPEQPQVKGILSKMLETQVNASPPEPDPRTLGMTTTEIAEAVASGKLGPETNPATP